HAAHAQLVREVDDRASDGEVGGVQVDVADEVAVDLHEVARQLLQVTEGGVASPEVIERNHRSEGLDPIDESPRGVQVVERDTLGDLEADLPGRLRVRADQRDRVLQDPLVVERRAAEVQGTEVDVVAMS